MYDFCFQKLISKNGLVVTGNDLDLTSAFLEVTGKPTSSPSYFNTPTSIGIKMISAEESVDYMYYRKFFPMILLFDCDVLSISKDTKNTLSIKLISKGQKRLRFEKEIYNFEINKLDLIKRINYSLRSYSLDLRKVLENLELSIPNLKEKELWEWYNTQDPVIYWSQLEDLQNLYEALYLIQSPHSNFYFVSLFPYQKNELLYLMTLHDSF